MHFSFFLFLNFLLLFNYSCVPFLPIPPPHSKFFQDCYGNIWRKTQCEEEKLLGNSCSDSPGKKIRIVRSKEEQHEWNRED